MYSRWTTHCVHVLPLQLNEQYLCVLMEALTRDKEDLRIVALTDLQKNPAIANVLPDIAAYLQETVTHSLLINQKYKSSAQCACTV